MQVIAAKLVTSLFWLLLAVGVSGALRISYANMIGVQCPHLFGVPACYLVSGSYLLMVLACLSGYHRPRQYLFAAGWSVAASLAVLGSATELLSGGGVCPTLGNMGSPGDAADTGSKALPVVFTVLRGMPMCYVSLALLLAILVLYFIAAYQRAGSAGRNRVA